MEMESESKCRIAWCDKKTNSYCQGHWRTMNDLNVIHAWSVCQNIHRRDEYYWVEIKEHGVIRNYTHIEPKKETELEKEYVGIDFKS